MATALGVSTHGFRKWVYGQREPSFATMRKIYVLTNGVVTPNDLVLISKQIAAAA